MNRSWRGQWKATNAFMEGFNGVFNATERKIRGSRLTIHLIANALLHRRQTPPAPSSDSTENSAIKVKGEWSQSAK